MLVQNRCRESFSENVRWKRMDGWSRKKVLSTASELKAIEVQGAVVRLSCLASLLYLDREVTVKRESL